MYIYIKQPKLQKKLSVVSKTDQTGQKRASKMNIIAEPSWNSKNHNLT